MWMRLAGRQGQAVWRMRLADPEGLAVWMRLVGREGLARTWLAGRKPDQCRELGGRMRAGKQLVGRKPQAGRKPQNGR